MKELATLLLECPICYELRDLGSDRTLRCGHGFHTSCINSWMRNAETCPLCRSGECNNRPPLSQKALYRSYAPINVAQVLQWPGWIITLKDKVNMLFEYGAVVVTVRKVTSDPRYAVQIFLKNDATYKTQHPSPRIEYTHYYFNERLSCRLPDRIIQNGKLTSFAPFDPSDGYVITDPAVWRAEIARILAAIQLQCTADFEEKPYEGVPVRDDGGYMSMNSSGDSYEGYKSISSAWE